jgi:pre-rRNA-processing protein RIX1
MSLLDTVLNAFQVLIPDHPTIFRPFASQIHSLLLPLIAPTTTHDSISDTTTALAQQLLVSLHHCAPKNTSGDEWTSALQATAKSVHHTADQVFRSVIEEWESSDSATRQQISKPKDFSEIVSDGGTDPLGMPAWTGIHDGIARLKGTLRLLANFVVQPTHSTVSLPVGSIIELTTRITSVTAPQGQNGLRLNPEITRDEREGLFTALPSIHVEAIAILLIILERLQGGALSIAHTILDQVLWIFETGSYNRDIRTATYTIIKALLPLLGPSLPRKSAKSLYPLIKACCDDLMTLHGVSASSTSSAPARSDSTQKPPQATSSTNADAFLGSPPSTNRPSTQSFQTPYPSLLQSASDLLPSPLTYIPPVYISPSLRAEIDRTAIILNHKEAMLASVLNPPSTKINSKTAAPSILPFLTRAFPGDPEVEALLRPRMPLLFTGRRHATNLVAREDDIEDDDVEMYDDTILAQEGQSQLPKETHTASNPHPDAQSSEEDLFGPLSAALNSPRRPSTDALLKRASLSADAESSTDAVLKRASLSADGPPWTLSGTHLDKAKAEDLPAAKKARIGSPEYEGSYAMTGAIQDMPAEPTAASEIVAAGRAVGAGETHLAGVEGVRAVAMGGTPDTSRLMGEPSDARSQDAHSQGKGIDEDDDDNSDGEIPALNIDSDTSEEEDAPT